MYNFLYKLGDTYIHRKFGEGIIKEIIHDDIWLENSYKIDFKDWGIKKLSAPFVDGVKPMNVEPKKRPEKYVNVAFTRLEENGNISLSGCYTYKDTTHEGLKVGDYGIVYTSKSDKAKCVKVIEDNLSQEQVNKVKSKLPQGVYLRNIMIKLDEKDVYNPESMRKQFTIKND